MTIAPSNFDSKAYILKVSAEPVWTKEEKEKFLAPLQKTIKTKSSIDISVTNQSKSMLNRLVKVIKEESADPVSVHCKVNTNQWIIFSNKLMLESTIFGCGELESGMAKINLISYAINFPKNKEHWGIFSFTALMVDVKETIMLLAGQSIHTPVDQLEWQFGIENCLKEDLEKAFELLRDRGFKVGIKQLSMRIVRSPLERELKTYQNLVVSFPKGQVIPPDNATMKDYGVVAPKLSADNYLILRNQLLKINPNKQTVDDFIPEDDYFEKILNDLKFLADKDPLVCRFTSDIARLDPKNRESLQKRLEDLGYEVSIEAPYLTNREFNREVWMPDYLRHNLVILLPEQDDILPSSRKE